MKTTIGQNGLIELSEIYIPIELVTNDNETMKICMRDSGFEFTYEGEVYHAKQGVISKIEKPPFSETITSETITREVPQSPNIK